MRPDKEGGGTPSRPTHFLRIFALLLLAIFVTFSLGIGAWHAVHYKGSEDLGPVYISARLWAYGFDPYIPANNDNWQTLTNAGPAPDSRPMLVRANPYPPFAMLNLAPLSLMDWKSARITWVFVNLGLALYVPWVIWRLWYRRESAFFYQLYLAVWLAGMGLRIGLETGQHILFAFAAILTSLLFMQRGWPVAAGFFLMLALHKYHFAVFLMPYFLATRRFRVLLTTAGWSVAALAIFCLRIPGAGFSPIRHYGEELAAWVQFQKAGGLPGVGVTHFLPVLQSIIGSTDVASLLMYCLMAAAFVASVYLVLRNRDHVMISQISLFLVLCLWVLYHEQQDLIILILPLGLLAEIAWFRSADYGRSRLGARAMLILLCGIWLADASEITVVLQRAHMAGLFGPHPLYTIDLLYRLSLVVIFAYLVHLNYDSLRISIGAARQAPFAAGPQPSQVQR